MRSNNILIIDDEEQLRKLLGRIISLEGFKVEEAGTVKAGFDFLKEAKARFPLIEIILLTAYGNIPDGVQAIKNGAFDYVTKGNDNDRIVPLLYQALDKAMAQKRSD